NRDSLGRRQCLGEAGRRRPRLCQCSRLFSCVPAGDGQDADGIRGGEIGYACARVRPGRCLDCVQLRLKSYVRFGVLRIIRSHMANAFFSYLLATISERGRSLLRRGETTDGKEDASALVELCEALLSGRGEASGTAMAREVLDRYHDLDDN